MEIEIVPAVLRRMPEKIEEDWNKIEPFVNHVQIDVTDGVFAGDGTWRELRWFKKLPHSEKVELHMMVHHPSYYLDDVLDLLPARCAFHLEAFSGKDEVEHVYHLLREKSQCETGLAINPETPMERLEEYMELIDYVLFMGYNPGFANQPIMPDVYRKIGAFAARHQDKAIAVDGHVDRETIGEYVKVGARRLCANTAIFKEGNPKENIEQLRLLAEAVMMDKEIERA